MTEYKSQDSSDLPSPSLDSYFNDSDVTEFMADEVIIDGATEPEGVYLIKSGFVKSYSMSHDGHLNLLLVHKAGEIIPLPWSLSGTNETGLSYIAMGNVSCIRSNKDTLRNAMGANGWLTREILDLAVTVISTYTKRIQVLEYRTARGRVVAELLFLVERFGVNEGTSMTIQAPITHQDIADAVNVTRETASRILASLLEDGIVSQNDRIFTINNLPALLENLK